MIIVCHWEDNLLSSLSCLMIHKEWLQATKSTAVLKKIDYTRIKQLVLTHNTFKYRGALTKLTFRQN